MKKIILFLLALVVLAGCSLIKDHPTIKAVYVTPAKISLSQTAKIVVDIQDGDESYYVEYRATYGFFSSQGASETVYYPTTQGIDTITVRLLSPAGEVYDSETVEIEVR